MAIIGWLIIALGVLLDVFNCWLGLRGLMRHSPSAVPIVGVVLVSGGGWLLSLSGELPVKSLRQWILVYTGLHVVLVIVIPLIGLGVRKLFRALLTADDV